MRNKRAKRFLCLPGERPEPEVAPATAKDADPQPEQPEKRATILMQITARAHKNKIITIQYFLMTADNKTSLDGHPPSLPFISSPCPPTPAVSHCPISVSRRTRKRQRIKERFNRRAFHEQQQWRKRRGVAEEVGGWSQHFKCVLVEIVKFSYGTIMMRHQFGFYVEAVRIFQRGLINSCRTAERVGRRGKSRPHFLLPLCPE